MGLLGEGGEGLSFQRSALQGVCPLYRTSPAQVGATQVRKWGGGAGGGGGGGLQRSTKGDGHGGGGEGRGCSLQRTQMPCGDRGWVRGADGAGSAMHPIT